MRPDRYHLLPWAGWHESLLAVWAALRQRKWFWLAPMILAFLLVAALLLLTDGIVVVPPEFGSGLVGIES
jgi:hypothetical protein